MSSLVKHSDFCPAYRYWLQKTRFLEIDEENELLRLYQDYDDIAAKNKLVNAYAPYIHKFANDFEPYGRFTSDLVQEGTVGFLRAMDRFDPSYGLRFIAFAKHWVKMEMGEFMIRNSGPMKTMTTKSHQKIFYNIGRYRRGLWMTESEKQRMAEDLSVTRESIDDAEKRLHIFCASIVPGLGDGDEGDSASGSGDGYISESAFGSSDYAPTRYDDTESLNKLKVIIDNGLDALPERNRDILASRYLAQGKPAPLREIAAKYGISSERVRQIESVSLKSLRALFPDSSSIFYANS